MIFLYGTLHGFACHPLAGDHANLLLPILVYMLPKRIQKKMIFARVKKWDLYNLKMIYN